MSSSSRRRPIIAAAASADDVFVLGDGARRSVALPEPVATAATLVAAAEERAALLEQEARAALEQARRDAEEIRESARKEGFAAGHREGMELGAREAAAEVDRHLEIARRAAEEGRAIRDSIVEQASGVIGRAAMLVARRIVGEYYEADPSRTAIAVEEAYRAAANQQVLSIRVHPSVAAAVQARLADVAGYVRPDDAVAIGGCIIDLAGGTIDATLDARLRLMELALDRAAGGTR